MDSTLPHIALEMVHLIGDVIQLALRVTRIKVTAPSPHNHVDRFDKALFTYLVHGMSINDADSHPILLGFSFTRLASRHQLV